MNRLFKNKKGLTLIELLVTLLLVSIIVVFIYRLILNLNNQTTNPEFAMSNQTIRTEIIRTIETDLVSRDIDRILLVYQDEDNNYNPAVYFYEKDRSSKVSVVDEKAIEYTSFKSETQRWDLVDCYVNFDSSEKGEKSGVVLNTSGIGNSTSSVSLNIVISNDNEHNSGVTSANNNLKDDILISYLGHNNDLRFCSKESTHKPEECRKYVLIYLDYNYPHRTTETLISTDQVVGETIKYPNDMKTVGYEFAYWYDSRAGGNRVPSDRVVKLEDENLVLYAHWAAKKVKITFDPNKGNTPSITDKEVTYDAKYGELASTSRTGYTFEGWHIGTESSSRTITKDSYVKTEADHTLYAHWKAKQFTVTFNSNTGGTPNPTSKTVTYDQNYGDLAKVSKTGYTFKGWWTAATGGTEITSSTKVQITSNQILYAHWEANKYTVTFDKNGGNNPSVASKEVTFDSPYGTLATISRTGYDFMGWYTAASGGTKVEATTIVKTASNHKLYAHWKAKTYTITLTSTLATTAGTPASVIATYDSANLNAVITNPKRVYTIKFTKGTATTISSTQETSTWTFDGWYTAASGGTKVIGTNGSFIASVNGYTNASNKWVKADNAVLYAHWTGGNITKPTATRTGYTCDFAGLVNPPTADKTYAATCTANTYKVTFDGNGCGTPNPTSKNVTYDSTYGDLPSTSKKGYQFDGWYTAKTNGTKITSSTKVQITAAQTLYAHCSAKSYTVTFNANGGTTPNPTSKSVTFDSTYGTLASTSRSIHTFDGWFTAASGGTKVETSTKVTTDKDHTLYAHWTAVCYTGYTKEADGRCHKYVAASKSCPSGYSDNGSTCVKTETANATKGCPSGYTDNGSTCAKTSTTSATASCPSGYSNNGSGCQKGSTYTASSDYTEGCSWVDDGCNGHYSKSNINSDAIYASDLPSCGPDNVYTGAMQCGGNYPAASFRGPGKSAHATGSGYNCTRPHDRYSYHGRVCRCSGSLYYYCNSGDALSGTTCTHYAYSGYNYSCSSGWTLSGTTCSKTETKAYTYTCSSGWTLSGTTCSRQVTTGYNYSCSSGTLKGTQCELVRNLGE